MIPTVIQWIHTDHRNELQWIAMIRNESCSPLFRIAIRFALKIVPERSMSERLNVYQFGKLRRNSVALCIIENREWFADFG